MIDGGKLRKPVGFTTKIVISLLFGLFCGLFFGESIQWIKWVVSLVALPIRSQEKFRFRFIT
jgi:Na+/H+-dicarboxylate symporter